MSETTSTDQSQPTSRRDDFRQDGAQRQDLFDHLFQSWEKRTSDYFDKLMRNPTFLNTMGGLLSASYRNKAQLDRALEALWKNLNLPNKKDQERTLHLLNELHSRIFDLEEKLQALTEENERLKARTQPKVSKQA